jgi:methionine-rich copper-binding protein CopC
MQHYVLPIPGVATGMALDEFDWILATAKVAEAYVDGPPKIVQALPAPGSQHQVASAPQQVVITFSEGVACSASDFELSGPGGPVPLGFNATSPWPRVMLTPLATLGPGVYTVKVRDTITSLAAGIALDGTIGDPAQGAVLPSGNGLPGGDGVYTFEIIGAVCYANCDGSTTPPVLNVEDFACFINEFAGAQGLPHQQQVLHYANCDGSTTAPVLNVEDFACFINEFAAGCR